MLCVISAISFTNTITPVYKTSVASVKFLISQNPNIAIIFFPAIIGSTSPPYYMFEAIISDPASPNPKARRAPILIMSFSNITVSYPAYSFFLFISSLLPFLRSSSKAKASYSSIYAASRGFWAILLTFFIIFSIGFNTSSSTSLENKIAPELNTIETNIVLIIESIAFRSLSARLSTTM